MISYFYINSSVTKHSIVLLCISHTSVIIHLNLVISPNLQTDIKAVQMKQKILSFNVFKNG